MSSSNILVIDDLLPKEEADHIEKYMFSSEFPWYVGGTVPYDPPPKTDPEYKQDMWIGGSAELLHQFVHMFYNNHIVLSPFYPLLTNIIGSLQPASLVRIKSNINWKTEKPMLTGYHKDTAENTITAIYYVNSNNGLTLFEDGSKVEPIKNRIILFNSHMKHSGTTCTNEEFRCIINFNYFQSLHASVKV